MRARPSEIRAYLYRYAAKNGIRIREHVSDWDQPTAFFCHLERDGKTATAVSQEGHDNALVMAFLSLADPTINFLD
jgi:hypothetical protein